MTNSLPLNYILYLRPTYRLHAIFMIYIKLTYHTHDLHMNQMLVISSSCCHGADNLYMSNNISYHLKYTYELYMLLTTYIKSTESSYPSYNSHINPSDTIFVSRHFIDNDRANAPSSGWQATYIGLYSNCSVWKLGYHHWHDILLNSSTTILY
jgi:hypothetical protein